MSVWEDASSKRSVILNADSARETLLEAQNDIESFKGTAIYPCICNVKYTSSFPKIKNFHKCSVWDACMLDVGFVQSLQNEDHSDFEKGEIMFVVGVVMSVVFFLLLIIFIVFIAQKRCHCCPLRQINHMHEREYQPVTQSNDSALETL
jgi:hypothetical protein